MQRCALAAIALYPVGFDRNALVSVLDCLRPILLPGVTGGAVREKDMVVRVDGDAQREEVDRLVIVLGRKGCVAFRFELVLKQGTRWAFSVRWALFLSQPARRRSPCVLVLP